MYSLYGMSNPVERDDGDIGDDMYQAHQDRVVDAVERSNDARSNCETAVVAVEGRDTSRL